MCIYCFITKHSQRRQSKIGNKPDFTPFAANTPAADGFQVSVSRDNADNRLSLTLRWDSAFNMMYGIQSYLLGASNGFISCEQPCSTRDRDRCQCSGLTAGNDGNITITAVTCGDQQGPPTVIYVTPRGTLVPTLAGR